jgi:hypothetical protein
MEKFVEHVSLILEGEICGIHPNVGWPITPNNLYNWDNITKKKHKKCDTHGMMEMI